MWLYQRKIAHNTILLWAKLAGISFFFHMLLLLLLFFIYSGNSGEYKIIVNKLANYSIPILLRQQNSSTPIVTQPVEQKMTQNNPKPTEKKQLSIKKQTPSPVSLNSSINTSKKEPVQKTITPPVPIASKKTEQKTITAPQSLTAKETTKEQNAIVSDNYRKVEALRRGNQLQKELVQHWKPPIGTPATCSCEISFTIDTHGKVQTIKVIRSSGVTMYDISARQALFSMHMPQWTHGKSLVITFQQ